MTTSTVSSAVSSPSSSLPQKQQPSAATPPVDILPTPAARTYAHVHPALLLAVYALRFPALVADPVSTLLSDLPIFAALQVGYVVTCLPQAGSSHHHHHHPASAESSGAAVAGVEGGDVAGGGKRTVSPGSSSTLVKAGKTPYRKKHHGHGSKGDGIFGKLTAAFLSLTLTFLLGTPVLAILLVLFGAPFTTHIPHTILCAAHMSLLSVTTLVYVHGVDGAVWKEVWALARPADAVWGGAVGTGVGAWLGAIPIPLDWDRPWQAYPITILTGAYLGYAVGSLTARTPLLYGKRIEFTPPVDQESSSNNQEASKEKKI
ncbi:hypothetical protein VTN77DRAFT_1913 [Rasamsonia byssochlamydoides]|uniref:uncharacterized protein n=1 Tax=Rasamsonia byssochlamydoides TaxID=89139 RepID=UPI0037443CC8